MQDTEDSQQGLTNLTFISLAQCSVRFFTQLSNHIFQQPSTTILYLNRIWSVCATVFVVGGTSLILELSLRKMPDLSLRNDVRGGPGRRMVAQWSLQSHTDTTTSPSFTAHEMEERLSLLTILNKHRLYKS